MKLIDTLMRRLGYVRADQINNGIFGQITFTEGEQPYVNLELPTGQRVSGWVDNRIKVTMPTNPYLEL